MTEFVQDQERIDTLLALAIASANKSLEVRRALDVQGNLQTERTTTSNNAENDSQSETEQDDNLANELENDALETFKAMREAEQRLLRRRHEWYAQLPADRQTRWLKFALGRALNSTRRGVDAARLDEHVHPSHIVEVLRREPAAIRRIVLANLPASLNAHARRELFEDESARNVPTALKAQSDDNGDASGLNARQHRHSTGSLLTTNDDSSKANVAQGTNGTEKDAEPSDTFSNRVSPECVDVVRKAFLSQFIHLEDLPYTSALDLLSGAELARLVRLLGARETAAACRGIAAVEAVASFLRRFAPEDARAIAAHMATLTDLTTERVRFAETRVQSGLHASSGLEDMEQMLDQAGLNILSLSLLERHQTAGKYMLQKFPVAAAEVLRRALEENRAARRADGEVAALMANIIKDTESFAAHLKRRARPAKTKSQGLMNETV